MIVASADIINLLESGQFGRRDMLLFDMVSGLYGFWNDAYDLVYSGVTYKGVPGAFQIADMQSTAELSIRRMDIIFSGLTSEIHSRVEAEPYHRRPVVGRIALIDESKGLVVDVMQWFTAVIDQVETSEVVGEQSSMVVRLDVGNWELARVSPRTRTSADQRAILSTDRGFEYLASAVSVPIWWGRSGPTRPDNAGTVTTPTNGGEIFR